MRISIRTGYLVRLEIRGEGLTVGGREIIGCVEFVSDVFALLDDLRLYFGRSSLQGLCFGLRRLRHGFGLRRPRLRFDKATASRFLVQDFRRRTATFPVIRF